MVGHGTYSLKAIFDSVQVTSACHHKFAYLIKNRYEKDLDKFKEEFLPTFLKCFSLEYNKSNPFITKLISFLAQVCSLFQPKKDEEDPPVFVEIIDTILKCSKLKAESARFWSCRIINLVFKHLDELSDETFEKLKENMIDRLQDSKPVIRHEAVLLLQNLQDPADEGDEIINSFLNLSILDINAKVRETCVSYIAINKITLPHIIQRIRDVNVKVRLAAYKRMCKLVKNLKIAERQQVLLCGMEDSDETVQNFVKYDLINSWLEIYSNDYFKLLKSVRYDACDTDVEETNYYHDFILKSIFEKHSMKDLLKSIKIDKEIKCLRYEDLNFESSIFYRSLLQRFDELGDCDVILEESRPELIDFCKYIKGFMEYVKTGNTVYYLEYQFILKQLFLISKSYDVGDAAGREYLQEFLRDVLSREEIITDVAEIVVGSLARTMPDVNNLSMFICEIISNIKYGTDEEMEAMKQAEIRVREISSNLKTEIAEHCAGQQAAMVDNNFELASQLEKEILTKQSQLKQLKTSLENTEKTDIQHKTDTPTILRYLSVTEAFLLSPKITSFSPCLVTLNSEIIEHLLIHDDDQIKTKALKCYGLLCILDKKMARTGIHILTGPIFAYNLEQECDVEMLLVCIRAVVDLVRLFGSNLIASPPSINRNDVDLSSSQSEEVTKVFTGGTSLSDIVKSLANFLTDENPVIQITAATGLSKILASENRINSVNLVSQLILRWATPFSDCQLDSVRVIMANCLIEIMKSQAIEEYLVDVILTTIRTQAYSPESSPWADINVENMWKFMLALCETRKNADQIFQSLANKIRSKMLDAPNARVNPQYSKILRVLQSKSTISEDGEVACGSEASTGTDKTTQEEKETTTS